MNIVKCRKCKTPKSAGDICPGGCGSGQLRETMRVRKGQPISVFKNHGFHAEAFGVGRTLATGRCRA